MLRFRDETEGIPPKAVGHGPRREHDVNLALAPDVKRDLDIAAPA
jgi:hypothetical protein